MPRLLIKPGVQFQVIAPAGYMILQALGKVARRLDRDLTITSGTDGDHSGPTDPHKLGEAYDVRSRGMDQDDRVRFLGLVIVELDPAQFYCFLESADTPNEHFHLQRRRNTTFTVAHLLERLSAAA